MLRRLVVIVLVSIVIGGLATAILAALYTNSRSVHMLMTERAYGVTAVVVFFLAFGISLLVMATTFITRDEWADLFGDGSERAGPGGRPKAKSAAIEDGKPGRETPNAEATTAASAPQLGTATAVQANPQAVPIPPPKPAQQWTGSHRDDPEDMTAKPPPPPPVNKKVKDKSPSPIDAAKGDVHRLLELSIAGLVAFGLKLEDKTRLGAALYLAGAAEAVAEKYGLKDKETLAIIESCIDLLQCDPAFAEAFAKDYISHLRKKENAAIFGAGRTAIMKPGVAAPPPGEEVLIEVGDLGQPAVPPPAPPPQPPGAAQAPEPAAKPAPAAETLPGLAIALDTWLGDESKADAQTGESVLVAEMVAPPAPEAQDTTSLNRMEVSRRVLRRALRTTGGIALKQTWGGIVATFPRASDAIAAAVDMQRGASEHTALRPAEPIVLKIGLASDRPDQRERAMPAAAELAARFLRHAKPGEIIADRQSCLSGGELGKAAKDRGSLALSGVVRPIQLLTVEWKTKPASGGPGPASAPGSKKQG